MLQPITQQAVNDLSEWLDIALMGRRDTAVNPFYNNVLRQVADGLSVSLAGLSTEQVVEVRMQREALERQQTAAASASAEPTASVSTASTYRPVSFAP